MSNFDPRPIVAETLRTASFWMASEEDCEILRRFADDVERAGPDDACCPLCEEVICDEGCVFESWRTLNQDGT